MRSLLNTTYFQIAWNDISKTTSQNKTQLYATSEDRSWTFFFIRLIHHMFSPRASMRALRRRGVISATSVRVCIVYGKSIQCKQQRFPQISHVVHVVWLVRKEINWSGKINPKVFNWVHVGWRSWHDQSPDRSIIAELHVPGELGHCHLGRESWPQMLPEQKKTHHNFLKNV